VFLDHQGFQGARGGGFAGRLRLFRLPVCALGGMPCADRPVQVPATNDVAHARISADLDASAGGDGGAPVYLLDTGTSGDAGDYRATDMLPSGSWSVGEQAGDFSYSYPLNLPEPPYGHAPDLALGYSAQAVDGRTSATNNQASWAGLGPQPGLHRTAVPG
jgi:hypothetical protein